MLVELIGCGGEVLALLGRFDEAEEAFNQARPPAEATGLKDVIGIFYPI